MLLSRLCVPIFLRLRTLIVSAARLTLIVSVMLCRFTLIQSVCCRLALHLMTCKMILRPDTNILLSSAGERK